MSQRDPQTAKTSIKPVGAQTKAAEPPEYLDCPERGGRFKYDRQATINLQSECDLNQLDVDEVVVWPGFIYRRVS